MILGEAAIAQGGAHLFAHALLYRGSLPDSERVSNVCALPRTFMAIYRGCNIAAQSPSVPHRLGHDSVSGLAAGMALRAPQKAKGVVYTRVCSIQYPHDNPMRLRAMPPGYSSQAPLDASS